MKYICLGYYDKSKHDAMTEAEKQAMFDTCFTYHARSGSVRTVFGVRLRLLSAMVSGLHSPRRKA